MTKHPVLMKIRNIILASVFCLITLSMVLTSVGLPTQDIALIMGIDRILDMSRTVVNITGDAICTMIIAKTEGEFDREKFETEDDGEEFIPELSERETVS